MVPHLVTALEGPLNEMEQRVLETMPAIERWFRLEWMEHTPPFYTSVDLRNAGFKLAPVDCNLFPRSLQHLTAPMVPLAVQAAMAAIEKICPEAKNLLVLADRHLQHAEDLPHLQQMQRIFNQAGLNVRLGTLADTDGQPIELTAPDGETVRLEPVVRQGRRLGLKHFDPCTILLNDDLARGTPHWLRDLHEQFLLPPLHAGWGVRRQSRHFDTLEEVAKRFAKLLGMDPWLIHPMHAALPNVNLHSPAGMDALRAQVDAVMQRTRRKYKDYGITDRAYVMVKADNGDGGRGALPVRHLKDLDQLDDAAWAQLGLLQTGPDGAPLSRHGPLNFLVQEGVPTRERVDGAPAETLVTLIDRYVVGGAYRLHPDRGPEDPLNGPGSHVVPLAFADADLLLPKPGARGAPSAPNRFYMYGVVARLSMLAASYELEATDPAADED